MKLNKDLSEFVGLLNSRNIKYLVVGGHAVAFHGHPRFTGDFDFFIERSPDNAEALEKLISDFGFGALGIKASDFMQPEMVIQLGRPPYRIDLLTSITGVSFEEAWNRKVSGELGGIPVTYVSMQDLIANKRATGRAQDIADIEKLNDD